MHPVAEHTPVCLWVGWARHTAGPCHFLGKHGDLGGRKRGVSLVMSVPLPCLEVVKTSLQSDSLCSYVSDKCPDPLLRGTGCSLQGCEGKRDTTGSQKRDVRVHARTHAGSLCVSLTRRVWLATGDQQHDAQDSAWPRPHSRPVLTERRPGSMVSESLCPQPPPVQSHVSGA